MTELEELQDRLNGLWIVYLNHLDEYDRAQRAIQQHFSKGFFELAQANRRSSGRHIGQDWYDQRCKATSRVSIEEVEQVENGEDALLPLEIRIQKVVQPVKHKTNDEEGKVQLPTPSATPERELSKEDNHSTSDTEVKTQKDPITWFGLFASANLRATQAVFISALHDAKQQTENGEKHDEAEPEECNASLVSRAVNASRALRLVEVEIRKSRKAIKAAKRSVTNE